MPFPARIAAIRKSLKLSQEKFGELVNVSQRTVAFWEAGSRTPSFSTLSDLSEKLNVSVDYLLGNSNDKNRTKEKQPAANNGELLEKIIDRLRVLPDPALSRVSDFVEGLEAGRQSAAAEAAADNPIAKQADPNPAGEPAG